MDRIQTLIKKYDDTSMKTFFASLGVPLLPDDRGRVYPASRQASALTDALRFGAEKVKTKFRAQATKIEKQGGMYQITVKTEEGIERLQAKSVVLCTGGKAAKNFGTDGSAYALATVFGHTVTKLYPSLVQLKTDTAHTKTLKGIRVNDGGLTARYQDGEISLQGDIIFTDYGVSGDAVFRVSAFVADKISNGVSLYIDLLPQFTETEIYEMLLKKRKAFPSLAQNELLGGIVNNQVGRAVMKRANNDLKGAAKLVKAFLLTVTGTLGFDYAQVTKGGVPMEEVTKCLESKKAKGLYFAGEILDIDGQCGGFNLQWAYSSACAVAEAILEKTRGQVCD
jgi:predicted Rossmann fold flavoprotein